MILYREQNQEQKKMALFYDSIYIWSSVCVNHSVMSNSL